MKEQIKKVLSGFGVPDNTFLLLEGQEGFMGISASAQNQPILHFNEYYLTQLGCMDDDIRAMLGHELGHWELGHCQQHTSPLFLFPIFSLLSMFFVTWPMVIILFVGVFFTVLSLSVYEKHQQEYAADAFAVDILKSSATYLNMLDKIQVYEKAHGIRPILHPSAANRKHFLNLR